MKTFSIYNEIRWRDNQSSNRFRCPTELFARCIYKKSYPIHASLYFSFSKVADCRYDFCIRTICYWRFLINRVPIGSWKYMLKILTSYLYDLKLLVVHFNHVSALSQVHCQMHIVDLIRHAMSFSISCIFALSLIVSSGLHDYISWTKAAD